MTEEQIIVQLNPDVPPTGSDLGITNAARRSFGKRSEWELTDKKTDQWTIVQGDSNPHYYKLKDKDKRLLEFLARGMTADDFDFFTEEVQRLGYNAFNQQGTDLEGLDSGFLLELLWEWRNKPTHDTPFSHSFFSFEVKAPIFVARHLVKHEYLIMSEYSRRYITYDVEFYRHLYRNKAEDVKQGSGGVHPTWNHGVGTGYMDELLEYYEDSLDLYNKMIDDGVAPEQVRGLLPQDLMTAWTWSGTLGAFANMCKLRLGKDTQAETRYVAEKVYEELKKQFPVAAPLLVEGVY